MFLSVFYFHVVHEDRIYARGIIYIWAIHNRELIRISKLVQCLLRLRDAGWCPDCGWRPRQGPSFPSPTPGRWWWSQESSWAHDEYAASLHSYPVRKRMLLCKMATVTVEIKSLLNIPLEPKCIQSKCIQSTETWTQHLLVMLAFEQCRTKKYETSDSMFVKG